MKRPPPFFYLDIKPGKHGDTAEIRFDDGDSDAEKRVNTVLHRLTRKPDQSEADFFKSALQSLEQFEVTNAFFKLIGAQNLLSRYEGNEAIQKIANKAIATFVPRFTLFGLGESSR